MTIHYNKTELKSRRRQLRAEMTYCEKLVWTHLRGKRTAGVKFRRQYSVDAYVIDFYSPSLKLAIELDGDVHSSEEQKKYDKARQEKIEVYGIRFLRFTNEEIQENPEKAFAKIESKIKELTYHSGKLSASP